MIRITRRDLIKSATAAGIGAGVTGFAHTFVEAGERRAEAGGQVPPGARPAIERNTRMPVSSVRSITATVGGPSTFALSQENATELVSSSSALVQRLLLDAFFTGARVEVELVPGSNVVRRVLPFEAGKPAPVPTNGYRVSRLATQRMPDGRDEHLEVFLVKGQDPEKAYNVYDQLLQQMLEAAFGRAGTPPTPTLHVEFDGNEIALLRVGPKG